MLGDATLDSVGGMGQYRLDRNPNFCIRKSNGRILFEMASKTRSSETFLELKTARTTQNVQLRFAHPYNGSTKSQKGFYRLRVSEKCNVFRDGWTIYISWLPTTSPLHPFNSRQATTHSRVTSFHLILGSKD